MYGMRPGPPASGTNAAEDRSSGNWRYTFVAGKAKTETPAKCETWGERPHEERTLMALLETVETRLLFRLTRFLAFVAILALSLALFIGAFRFADELIPNQSSEVTFNEISRELHPAPEAIQPGSSSFQPGADSQSSPSLDLPFALQPYFSSSVNRAALMRQMEGLDSSERTEYLGNLSKVVKASESNREDTTNVINKYFELKQTQLNRAKADSAARTKRLIYIAASAFSIMFLIAMASLILVLLAIERNTRSHAIT
jgi:hypothetical protein